MADYVVEERESYLLYAARNEGAILGVHLLEHKPSAVTSPGRLHLSEDPLVSPEATGVVEVDGMVQTNHHANLRPWVSILGRILTILYTLYALDIGLVDKLLTLQLGVVHL
jgi:hypothetical protein